MCPNYRRNKYLQIISKCVQIVVDINIYKKKSKSNSEYLPFSRRHVIETTYLGTGILAFRNP